MKQLKRYAAAVAALFLTLVMILCGCTGSEGTGGIDAANLPGQSAAVSSSDGRREEEAADTAQGKEEEAADTAYGKGTDAGEQARETDGISESGTYSSKDEVALYIHRYGHLPDNYITKKEAENLGWDSSRGNLWEAAPGKSIGGGRFGNYEGLLPEEENRQYYECDIDYNGGYRNEKRIVYSNDGLIYYTGDHYESFELLYGDEQ